MGQNIGIASGLAFVGANFARKFGFHSKFVKNVGFFIKFCPTSLK